MLTTVLITALLGGWLGDRVSARSPLEDGTERLLKTFTAAVTSVEKHYARSGSTQNLVENAIRGMLRTLDPHSSLFNRGDYRRLKEEQLGRYYGLGITIRAESPGSGRVVVMEPPLAGTPAYKAGIRVGDVISKIEGQAIDDWDLNEEVIPNLKGPKGTKVNITIERSGESEPLDVIVIRDEIPLYTIRYNFFVRPEIGYIRISKFAETTGNELTRALKELSGEELKGLILDLRDNPGGALNQALAVADHFLEKRQVIVRTRGRTGQEREFRVRKGAKARYPMVVLINKASASASEIVAGALQDHDRALIVGEASFGKALVQTIYPLYGNRGLALTTGKYYTPSNRLIQRDYSDSFYGYYYGSGRNRKEAGSEHQTDAGRTVFGGGGITPDKIIGMAIIGKLDRLLSRRNIFVEFVSKLIDGEIQSDVRYQYSPEECANFTPEERERLVQELKITDRTLSRFKDFARETEAELTDESFEENLKVISNRLKQELFLRLFDDKQSFKVALDIDPQVQKAIELIPRVNVLLLQSVARN